MVGKLWLWAVGVMLLLAVSGGLVMLVYTTIISLAGPHMGGICPGNPECG